MTRHVSFFARDRHGETAGATRIAPAPAAVLLAGIVLLAVRNYATLLGMPPGDPAVWALPASYGAVAILGLGWGFILKARRPEIYAAIGLGAHAVTGRLGALAQDEDGARWTA
jgi:hypothetical protein